MLKKSEQPLVVQELVYKQSSRSSHPFNKVGSTLPGGEANK